MSGRARQVTGAGYREDRRARNHKEDREILAKETSDEGWHSLLVPGMIQRGSVFEEENGNRLTNS